MELHPPDPCFVHRLPPAATFVGRAAELEKLRRFWQGGGRGVLAVVGLGGAGKTALVARFLDELLVTGSKPQPDGLFVWSFYQEPDPGLFLQEVYHYFARAQPSAIPARGAGLLHLLDEVLLSGGPHLLVLDGLERVQRQGSADGGVLGQIEDPLLKGLLTRIAEGMGQTAALVTSRFPLPELASLAGFHHVEVGGLDRAAALTLLRQRGVKGDDETALGELIEAYGAHALTLDHLGGLIGRFLGGDPRRAPEAPTLADPGSDRQALRLARLLRAYEEHLPAAELALLCRLCLLRRSVGEEQLQQLFLCTPVVRRRTIRKLPMVILTGLDVAKYAKLELPKDDFFKKIESHVKKVMGRDIQETIEECLDRAPLAGPEETFQKNLCAAVEEGLFEQIQDSEINEFIQLYSDAGLDVVSDLRPLPTTHRVELRELCARYVELRDHPLLSSKPFDPALQEAFEKLGWQPSRPDDLSPSDVKGALAIVRGHLCQVVSKHQVLKRIRQLCRTHQQKWTMAGPLAPLDAAELCQVLETLISHHLVLRESDGSFSVHPAVRDHFRGLAAPTAEGNWHNLVREQMISLVQRPGRQLPEDRLTLDLVEEAIYHSLEAGRTEDAQWLYSQVLGGLRHLAWKLGEMSRGLRILRGFRPCPDPWALGWFLRALGELQEAYDHNPMPYFRADIRLLQGRLPEVAAEGDDARAAMAAFLMGRTRQLPPDCLGSVIPRAQILLYVGGLERALNSSTMDPFYKELGWEGDRARCQLWQAEIARRLGDGDRCRRHLEAASRWILHAGSVEHLCLWHLISTRAARDMGNQETAQRAVTEGLHLARQWGLGLYHVELLCEQVEILLGRSDGQGAESFARLALHLAALCRFRWGKALARHLLGRALAAQGHCPEARAILKRALALRRRLGDPRAQETESLLNQLAGR